MPRLHSPCLNCKDRVVGEDRKTGCHSHCELYKQFQEASEKNKEEYHKSLIWDKYHEAQVKKLKGKR